MSLPLQTVYRSVEVAPGESFILPPGATLQCTSNAAALESECITLPSCEIKCYEFSFATETAVAPLPMGAALQIVALYNGATKMYDMGINFGSAQPSDDFFVGFDAIIPSGVLKLYDTDRVDDANASTYYLRFTSPDIIGENLFLEVSGAYFPHNLFIKAAEIDCPAVGPTP